MKQQKIELQAQVRTVSGKKVKSLRNSGYLPAVIYGHNFAALSVQIPYKDFEKIYKQAGGSTVVYLSVDGKDYPTIIHDVSVNPLSEGFLHADFYKVKLDEKITAKISLRIIGESQAVEELGGILVKNISELEVEAFPQDLPHEISVDITALKNFRDHVLVKDLPISDKVKVRAKPDEVVVLIQEPISEEKLKEQLETQPATAAEDVEVIKKEKKEEEMPPEEATPPVAEKEPKSK